MPPDLVHPELAGDFARQSVQLAAERAAALGRPVLAILPMATPYIEPAEWLRLELGRSEVGCYLGSQEEELACAGAAQILKASGNVRFADVRGQLRALFSEAVFALPFLKRVARAFCTFAFSKKDSGGPWAGMPQNLCIIPDRMLLRRRGTVWGAQVVRVAPDGTLLEGQTAAGEGLDVGSPGWAHETWLARSAEAIERIRAGKLEKVVLVRREARELEDRGGDDARGLGLIEELRARHPRCTVYWVGLPGGRSFVGATPEQLVRVKGRRVSTMALAGTVPNGDAAQDVRLLTSAKNRHEQHLVVREIIETLQGLCTHVRVPDEPRVLRLGNVCHLQSNISGRLSRERHILDLVAALHPTPAVGGLPREKAREVIEELEPEGRGWYAGPIGWCDAVGEGEFFVALRGARLTKHRAHLLAGCGLVSESDPEEEWQETGWKMKAMGEVLAAHGRC